MKKSMKKFMVACAAVSAMTAVAGMSAMAAEYNADTNTATYEVPAAADSTQMTVLVIPEGSKGSVQDTDILYINQDEKGGAVNGTAALKGTDKLADGNYLVMVGYYDSDSTFKIAEDTFTVGDVNPGVDVLVGDVDQNGKITASDASAVLTYIATEDGITEGTASFYAAAKSDNNDKITASDASAILVYIAAEEHDYVGKTVTVNN
jgi:hypothetical protein